MAYKGMHTLLCQLAYLIRVFPSKHCCSFQALLAVRGCYRTTAASILLHTSLPNRGAWDYTLAVSPCLKAHNHAHEASDAQTHLSHREAAKAGEGGVQVCESA